MRKRVGSRQLREWKGAEVHPGSGHRASWCKGPRNLPQSHLLVTFSKKTPISQIKHLLTWKQVNVTVVNHVLSSRPPQLFSKQNKCCCPNHSKRKANHFSSWPQMPTFSFQIMVPQSSIIINPANNTTDMTGLHFTPTNSKSRTQDGHRENLTHSP